MVSLRQLRWVNGRFSFAGWRWMLGFGLSMGLVLAGQQRLPAMELAQSDGTTQIKTLLQQFDTIANQHKTDRLKEIVSPEFSNSDGLTLSQLESSLQSLWKLYPDLTYSTQLQSWRQDGKAIVVDTVTTVTGNRPWLGNTANLKGEIASRQTFVGDKLVRQEILSEKMTLTAGAKPPAVDVRLPKTVKPGQQYDFDVILQNPLGEDLLAGTAFAQNIDPSSYQWDPTQVKLELLQAGGLFKRVTAGQDPQWLSALLVGPEGMVLVTQRLAIAP